MAWFRRTKKKKEPLPVEKMELRGIFFFSSVVLVILTYWMLFDEARPRRPWKDYQIQFNQLEYRMVQDELKAAQAAQAAQEPEIKALEAELQRAEGATADAEMTTLLKEKAAKERELAPVAEKVAFTKAELDEAHYYEEKALFENGGNREALAYKQAKKDAEAVEKRLKEWQPKEDKLSQEIEALEQKILKKNEAALKVREKLAELRAPVLNLQRRLEGIKGRIPEIQQVIVEGLDLNEFKQPTLRVDRCMTCHVGAGRAGFEKEKLEQYGVPPHLQKVFMSHPYREVLIGKHATAQFGCSACHQGQPPVLEVEEAHSTVLPAAKPAPATAGSAGKAEAAASPEAKTAETKSGAAHKDEAKPATEPAGKATEPAAKPAAGGHGEEKHFYWERPLLVGEMLQASCRRCHSEQDVIPLAPVYSQARAMVADLGCFGCHNIRGFEKAERVGPELSKIRTKVDPSWLVRWIQNPKDYLPRTKMPVFKNGPGEKDLLTDREATGIAAYLLKFSADDPEQRGAHKGGSAEKGRELVKSLGCLGCHMIKGLEPPAQATEPGPGQAPAPAAETGAPKPEQPKAAEPEKKAEVKAEPEKKAEAKAGPEEKAEAKAEPEKKTEVKAEPEKKADGPSAGEAKGEEEKKVETPEAAQAEQAKKPEGAPQDEKAAAQARVAAIVAVKPTTPPGNTFGPDLSRVASKVNADWLYRWLLNPKRHSQKTNMPNLRLSLEDAGHITAFLMTQGRKVEIPGVVANLRDEAFVKEGERLIRKRGCFGCHTIQGFETADKIAPDLTGYGTKRLLELFFGEAVHIKQNWADFTLNKLLNPQVYQTERVEQIMPNFQLSLEQAKALRVFLKAQNDDRAPKAMTRALTENEVFVQDGRRLIRRYNCDGCHRIEAQGGAIAAHYEQINLAPPPLVEGHLQEGEKVQSTWLYEWLARPTSVRPWLKVRMPTFGVSIDEATAVTRYFGALANVRLPYEFVRAEDIPRDYLEAGRKLMSKDYFDCFSCHVQGSKNPEGPPEGWAPDLALARFRLRPAWIEKWLRDPQRIQPGTKMPSFFTDTEGIPDDILKDPKDPDKKKQLDRQVRALRDYIMSLGEQR